MSESVSDLNARRHDREVVAERFKKKDLEFGGGGGDSGSMTPDDTRERVARLEVSFQHVDQTLGAMRTEARQHRNAVIFTILTSVIALFGLFYAAQSTLLSAFQSGLSAIQSVSASRPGDAPQPIIIQIPAQPAPAATPAPQ